MIHETDHHTLCALDFIPCGSTVGLMLCHGLLNSEVDLRAEHSVGVVYVYICLRRKVISQNKKKETRHPLAPPPHAQTQTVQLKVPPWQLLSNIVDYCIVEALFC